MRPGTVIRVILPAAYCLCCAVMLQAQVKKPLSSYMEQQLENEAEADNADIKDDAYLQQLDYYERHPLHINEADAGALESCTCLPPCRYRHCSATAACWESWSMYMNCRRCRAGISIPSGGYCAISW